MLNRYFLTCAAALALSVTAPLMSSGQANAQELCRVADPTNTPLNVRSVPDGKIVGTLNNGDSVIALDRSSKRGKDWVYVGRAETRLPVGWVFLDYLDCHEQNTINASKKGPSFNCTYAKAPDEISICQSEQLAAQDREMASEYSWGFNNFKGGFREYLKQTQNAWLKRRHACGYDAQCISKAYEDRLVTFADGDIELSEFCRNNQNDADCQKQPSGYNPVPPDARTDAAAISQPRASIQYDGKNSARLEYGDLVIKVDRDAAPDKASWLPVVDATNKAGARLFSIRLVGDQARGEDEPAAEVRVMRLNPANAEPQVVFTYFWGGAHCCTVTDIATMGVGGNWRVIDGGALDGDGYEFRDLDQDGGSELISVDNSFLYAFGCYACSYAPTRIKKLYDADLKDVTTDAKYQTFLRQRLRQMEVDARNSGESDTLKSPGYLAGWVAAKTLVGESWTLGRRCLIPISQTQTGRRKNV